MGWLDPEPHRKQNAGHWGWRERRADDSVRGRRRRNLLLLHSQQLRHTPPAGSFFFDVRTWGERLLARGRRPDCPDGRRGGQRALPFGTGSRGSPGLPCIGRIIRITGIIIGIEVREEETEFGEGEEPFASSTDDFRRAQGLRPASGKEKKCKGRAVDWDALTKYAIPAAVGALVGVLVALFIRQRRKAGTPVVAPEEATMAYPVKKHVEMI